MCVFVIVVMYKVELNNYGVGGLWFSLLGD